MTVTKSRNLIANRNTGGDKKQGLAPSIGKSSNIRQSQLWLAQTLKLFIVLIKLVE